MLRYICFFAFTLTVVNVSAVQLPAATTPVNSKSSAVQLPMSLEALKQSLNAYHWNMSAGNYHSLAPEILAELWVMVQNVTTLVQIKKRALIILSHHLNSVTIEEYMNQWHLEKHIAVKRQLLRNVIILGATTNTSLWVQTLKDISKTDDQLSNTLIESAINKVSDL